MKNKFFLIGIIIILVFGIIGFGCGVEGGGGDGGGSGNNGGGSGSDNGGDGEGSGSNSDGGSESGDSGGSGSNDYNNNSNSGIYIFIGSGSGSGSSKNYYDVKYEVTSLTPNVKADIVYTYPDPHYSYSNPAPNPIVQERPNKKLPWVETIRVSSKVLGRGVTLTVNGITPPDNIEPPVTVYARIYIDGKVVTTDYGSGNVSINWPK